MEIEISEKNRELREIRSLFQKLRKVNERTTELFKSQQGELEASEKKEQNAALHQQLQVKSFNSC